MLAPNQKYRVIRVTDITQESFVEFSEVLAEFEEEHPDDTCLIELSSDGGDAIAALAFAARIRLSLSVIHVVVFGAAESAAVLVLAAGDRRLMTRESWVMVHEDTGKITGSVSDMEKNAAHFRQLEDQWAELLEELTCTPAKKWVALHKTTTYLTAEECLDLKLIDEII